jgi:hypothetical protein
VLEMKNALCDATVASRSALLVRNCLACQCRSATQTWPSACCKCWCKYEAALIRHAKLNDRNSLCACEPVVAFVVVALGTLLGLLPIETPACTRRALAAGNCMFKQCREGSSSIALSSTSCSWEGCSSRQTFFLLEAGRKHAVVYSLQVRALMLRCCCCYTLHKQSPADCMCW